MRYIVIPAYDPDEKMLKLIEEVSMMENREIIVVDDGSSKDHESLFEVVADSCVVLRHNSNRGKGRAIKTALQYIQKQEQGIVVIADADGQHTPSDIQRILHACERDPKAFYSGERCFTGEVPLRSRIGNTITRHIFHFVTGLDLYDTQCGLRAFSTTYLPFLLQVKGDRYEYEMNVLLESVSRFPIKTIAIHTVYLDHNRSSHFHPLKDAWRIYRQIFRFLISSLLGFVMDYVLYAVLIFLMQDVSVSLRLMIANLSARICSASLNYCLNRSFVFQSHANTKYSVVSYALLAFWILILNTTLLIGLQMIGFDNLYVLKIMVEAMLFVLSWYIQKHIIFKQTPREEYQ